VPVIHDTYHYWNGRRRYFVEQWLPRMFGGEGPPENAIVMDNLDPVLTPSDAQPRPADVHVDVPDRIIVATVSAEGTPSTIVMYVPRTWSENAERFGLSMAIRLDTLWPYAINAWQRNIFLGSGYGTINKGDNLILLTEADSVDNNFLRTLGETGLIGFVLFYGTIVVVVVAAARLSKVDTKLGREMNTRALGVSYVVFSLGLAVNALFIDVYAASKVAMILWALTGFLYAVKRITDEEVVEKSVKSVKNVQSAKGVKVLRKPKKTK
jgi:hypothetical protein